MAKQTNPKAIGIFVVGAFLLVVAGLVVFGAGKFFATTQTFVLFFKGSVGGLNVGAPVNFRGVRIGSVQDIHILYNAEDDSLMIPVFIDIEPDRVVNIEADTEKGTKEYIDLGFRGQLGMQSFVTGQLSVDFDFYPGTPVHLTGVDMGYPELPTIPSDMAQLKSSIESVAEKLSELQLDELIQRVGDALNSAANTMETAESMIDGLDEQVKPIMLELLAATQEGHKAMSEAKLRFENKEGEVFHTANAAAQDVRELIQSVEPMLADARTLVHSGASALEKTEATMGHASELIQDLGTQVQPLSNQAEMTLEAARIALEEAAVALQDTRDLIAEVGGQVQPISQQAQETLQTATAGLREAQTAVQESRTLIANVNQQIEPIIAETRVMVEAATSTLREGKVAMQDARALIAEVDQQVDPMVTEAQTALQTATAAIEESKLTMKDARALIAHADDQIEPISTGAQEMLQSATAVADEAQGAVQDTRTVIVDVDERIEPLLGDAKRALQAATTTLEDSRQALLDVGSLARSLDSQVEPLSNDAKQTLQSATVTLDEATVALKNVQKLVRNIDESVEPLTDAADQLVQGVLESLEDARAAMAGARSVLATDSPVMFQLNQTLREINAASRAMRHLAEYLERNPNALLVGKN